MVRKKQRLNCRDEFESASDSETKNSMMHRRRPGETESQASLRRDANARRTADSRLAETEEERSARCLANARRNTESRLAETEEERSERCLANARRNNESRLAETEEERSERCLANARRNNETRLAETEEERSARCLANARRNNESRLAETEEERSARCLANARRNNESRLAETEEKRSARCLANARRNNESRLAETEEERSARCLANAQRTSVVRLTETDEEAMKRKIQDNQRISSRRQLETPKERDERLEQLRTNRANASCRVLKMTARAAIIDNLEESIVELHNMGEMNVLCEFCNAKHFARERPTDKKFTVCCNKGKVKIQNFATYEYIKRLLTGKDPDSKHFMEHIRSYNNAFAFASVGAQIKAPPGYGPYCYRIHGQIYHRAGTLHPEEGEPRKYAQLYILDPDEATSQRLNEPSNVACKNHVMSNLLDIMKDNPFARAFKMLHEFEKEEKIKEQSQGHLAKEVTMAIVNDRALDNRRYNMQTCNEVAIIFSNTDGEPPLERDLLIHLRPTGENSPTTKRISILNKNLDALTYPLLYPYGEQGWGEDLALCVRSHSTNVNTNSRKRVTLKMYYSYIFSVRETFSPFLSAGKLTQQYFVDAYVKAEANDLNFVRQNQSKLRAGSYDALVDYMDSVAEQDGIVPGKPIILPSTFQGSRRNMNQNYQDAMSIVRKFGKPDLFITMTCNPKWFEITANLEDGQKPENRPDLVARVFNVKLRSMLEDLTKKCVLGHVLAKVHVIEFQKRGLPHAHILIILKDIDKPRTVDLIDKIVCAEIPNNETHPRLFDVVTKNMIHGPCDKINSKSPCLVAGKCSKGFPKPFQHETLANVNGFPFYRRRNLEPVVTNKNIKIDNRWVVPYNPYLSLKYNCHINVEICASIRSVKYLFKYAYKGHDCAKVELRIDEIKTHVDSRYVSPPEAAWRIFRFPMQDRTHSISRLKVELPGKKRVSFDPNKIQEAIHKAENTDSTLTAFFELNTQDPKARQYKYAEIPEYYVFNAKNKWVRRKDGHTDKVIGRLYSVSMSDGERYFLRLLLLHVAGPTSYDDLLKYQGHAYDSFYEVAKARGLICDQTVWNDTLNDAAYASMPRQLRELFAYICVFGETSDMTGLWNEHKENLTEDFVRVHGHPSDEECDMCESYALRDISETLITHGRKCSDYKLKDPPSHLPLNLNDFVDIELERGVAEDLKSTLTEEQLSAFEAIEYSINSAEPVEKCFFLDGPGGSGKTYLYKTLLSYVRGQGDIALPVASTGIAANLLKGGRTYHSQYKLPLNLNETSVSSIEMTTNDATLIRTAKLLIWDESTMASVHALHCIDRLLKEIMRNDLPFGGKVLLLGGDFRQTLPIIPHGDAVSIVQASIKFSHLWRKFQILKLNNNVRSLDKEYSDWLIKLGNGELTNVDGLQDSLIEIPEAMLATENIIKDIFGESLTPEKVEQFSKMAILCPTNADVDEINEQVLKILQGECKTYLSTDSIMTDEDSDRDDYPTEFLNTLNPSGSASHELKLKVGSLIMLLRNLNTKRGLCNGTRLVVVELKPNLIIAKVLTGSAEGNIVFIPRIDLIADSDLPFQLRRLQFPVKLAFAMTINKSQGQTLDKVGIYLATPVFSHGQLYVAFSRVRRSSDVRVYVRDMTEQGKLLENSNKVFTRNVVFKDVLQK
ncbi:uncharacterized protein LOC110862486 [Folsomia candida]|uniref:uncharacterized protein LOC110862486 n=1 Tax=Folsomia candida TaxID=158441 RepID=UPI000B901349|nr:uncharacterized protein LOC110862486 [Folsomia candida]